MENTEKKYGTCPYCGYELTLENSDYVAEPNEPAETTAKYLLEYHLDNEDQCRELEDASISFCACCGKQCETFPDLGNIVGLECNCRSLTKWDGVSVGEGHAGFCEECAYQAERNNGENWITESAIYKYCSHCGKSEEFSIYPKNKKNKQRDDQ